MVFSSLQEKRSTKGASKQRRDLINNAILQLRDLLPLSETARQRLSQLQVMSLVCVFMRKNNFFQSVFGNGANVDDVEADFSQSLPGFLLVVSRDGKLVYISENVTEYLGHSMVDMLTQGDTLWDIVDRRDHGAVRARLVAGRATSADVEEAPEDDTFFCRMNVARSLRRQCSFREQKTMMVRGHFLNVPCSEDTSNKSKSQQLFFAVVSPLVTPDVKESLYRHNTNIFWTEHAPDMRIEGASDLVEHHLGYEPEELTSRSWYELLHPEDLEEAKDKHMKVVKAHPELGVMLTARLQTAEGGWRWTNCVLTLKQREDGSARVFAVHCAIRDEEAGMFQQQCDLYTRQMAQAPHYMGMSPPHAAALAPMSPPNGGLPYGYHEAMQQEMYMTAPNFQRDSLLAELFSGMPGSPHDGLIEAANMNGETRRQQLMNRLKRKVSEPADCRPAKHIRLWSDNSFGGTGYESVLGGSDFSSSLDHLEGSGTGGMGREPMMMEQRYGDVAYGGEVGVLSAARPQAFPPSPVKPAATYSVAPALGMPPTPEMMPGDIDLDDVLSLPSIQSDSVVPVNSPQAALGPAGSPAWMPPTPSPVSPPYAGGQQLVKSEPVMSPPPAAALRKSLPVIHTIDIERICGEQFAKEQLRAGYRAGREAATAAIPTTVSGMTNNMLPELLTPDLTWLETPLDFGQPSEPAAHELRQALESLERQRACVLADMQHQLHATPVTAAI